MKGRTLTNPRRNDAAALVGCLVTALAPSLVLAGEPALDPWVLHDTFEDFATGTFGDGGSNIYATAGGTVELIHRWDLNNDGFLDVLASQAHDTVGNEDVLIYWGGQDGPRSIMPPVPDHQPLGRLLRQIRQREGVATRLPSDGAGRAVLADLNTDGWPEIVFCNHIHNYSVHMDAFVYWGGPEGYGRQHLTRLPTLMAAGVAAADFNGDGFVDLAFANEGTEGGGRFGYHHHLASYVYWNGPTGFADLKRTELPSVRAVDCAAGDVNGDGLPELLIVNRDDEQNSIYLYWNVSGNLSADRRMVIARDNPVGVELMDLNGDHRTDLVIMHGNNTAEILLNRDGALQEGPGATLATNGALKCRAADLNKDGRPDLVFSNPGGPSFVYWADAKGFSKDRRAELPTLAARDVAIADFNLDGWQDLAFANEHDAGTYDVNSHVYWNSPDGFDPAHRRDLQGFGAVAALAGDLNKDRHADLVLLNRHSGRQGGSPGTLIYWGNPRAHYSQAAVKHLTVGHDVVATADLDRNGFVDLIYPTGDIYWGSAEGYDEHRRLTLKIPGGTGVCVADLNRDGHLDLLYSAGSVRNFRGLILWGSEDGYSVENKTELPVQSNMVQTPTIADLNKDGHLDLVFPDVDSPNLEFFWGGANGTYGPERHTRMQVQSASTVEVADLNGDGWLDLVLGGTYDNTQFGRPTRHGVILWGGPDGYDNQRSQRLEAYESEEQVVADLNQDGFLDIVMSNYHGHTTRTIPVFIYWGGPDGTYSSARRTSLPAESSLALTVADFNRDRWLDLLVHNHIKDGDHGYGSHLYWGSPQGFDAGRRDWIQTFGVHFGAGRDIGNIYDRKLRETYESAPLEAPAGRTSARLSWSASTPHGTAVRFQARWARASEGLTSAAWHGPDGAGSYYDCPDATLSIPVGKQWMQYRAVLTTPDGGSTPVLERVRLDAFASE